MEGNKRGKVIIVEGIPGVGKSSYCENFALFNKNVVIIKEWVDNTILKEYLFDMKNNATSFQFLAQEESIKETKRS